MNLKETVEELLSQTPGHFAVVVKDLRSGFQIRINDSEPYVAASIIKVPIMVEAFRQWEEGVLDLSRKVRLNDSDKVEGSGILQVLSGGVELPLIDLIRLMIVVSDNTATNLVLDLIGMENVNRTMATLGLSRTVIFNKLMVIPHPLKGKNTTTAADAALLLEKIARGQVISYRACRWMIEILKAQQFNDLIPALLPEDDGPAVGSLPGVQVAHKTGSISGTRHDAGIVFLPDREYVLVIFSRDLSDVRAGEETIRKVSRAVFDHFVRPMEDLT